MEEKRYDIIIILVTLVLVIIGTVMIYSSSSIMATERFNDGYYFLKKQLVFVLLGLVIMIVMSKIPYRHLRKVAYLGILVSLVLLCVVLIPGFGVKVGGATRWMRIGGFSFQVAEVVKVALVIFLAHFFTKKAEHIREFLKVFLVPLIITFTMVGLILLQPDFGTSVVIMVVMLSMFFLAGCRIIYISGVLAAFMPAGIALIMYESYRLKRLLAFLDPWQDPTNSGFQIIQSFISFGSGGTFGVGIGNSMQKLFYLPEPHTDFILSVIAEEGGFIAVTAVITLFIILVIRGFLVSLHSSDLFGTLLAGGLTVVIAVGVFINTACVMGLLPTKGLALPFLSYGGTSLIISMAIIGILLNISSSVHETPLDGATQHYNGDHRHYENE
ncbi:MAG TPA: putative lipid II flippase FtsW [Deltaproteobacteria bacterium]|nr:putative lipid II flippase FtsW [Deltaproteobacteria bacterium]